MKAQSHHHSPKGFSFLPSLETLKVRWFGFKHIPLLFFCGPQVLTCDDHCCRISMALNYFTKNHLGSMYFGALSIGADTVIGLLALRHIEKRHEKVSFIFKDFQAQFLKRAEGEVEFFCGEGEKIESLVHQAVSQLERVHQTIQAKAFVKGEVVAQFQLTLSLKKK